MSPLVSICVPTYNGDKYLLECLESCVNQSFKDYEIIICDDASSDNTISIIESYAVKNSFIKFTKNEKKLGLVGNWNKCLELSSGDWIKFVFQDDVITFNCLEKFQNSIEDGIELIVCKRNFKLDKIATDDEKDYYLRRVKTLENTGSFVSNLFTPKVISKIAANNIGLNFIAEPSLTFFNKNVLTKIGMFDSDLKQICDLEFLLRLSSNCGLKYLPQQLCVFRIHSNSTTEKNVTAKNYFIENLVYAIKLKTKTEFNNLRNLLSFFEMLKLNLYIKYYAYKAYKAIDSKESETNLSVIKNKYSSHFYNQLEIPLLILLEKFKG